MPNLSSTYVKLYFQGIQGFDENTLKRRGTLALCERVATPLFKTIVDLIDKSSKSPEYIKAISSVVCSSIAHRPLAVGSVPQAQEAMTSGVIPECRRAIHERFNRQIFISPARADRLRIDALTPRDSINLTSGRVFGLKRAFSAGRRNASAFIQKVKKGILRVKTAQCPFLVTEGYKHNYSESAKDLGKYF